MKNLIIKNAITTITFVFLAFAVPSAIAQVAEARVLRVINPSQSNGIQIGDVMNRTMEIEVSSPYQIAKNALPMKGLNRNGIELADITVKKLLRDNLPSNNLHSDNKNIYTITLRYQVFASAAQPVVMQLPEETFALTGGAKALSIKVPAWHFWFSPLVTEGISNAKENLQPQFKPTLVDINLHHTRLWLSFGLLITGLIGLIYINADRRWLPFMNGAFAQAHRELKKLGKSQANQQTVEKNALIYLHQAFNAVHGENLFANEVERFLAAHPEFYKLKANIIAFFDRSNASLFASQQPNSAQFIDELIVLSKSLRDCERGV